MILTQEILKLIEAQIKANCSTITQTYLGIAPQEAEYPFATILPVSLNPDYTFANLIEYTRIQISVFDDQWNKTRLITAGKCLENQFHRNESLQFPITTPSLKLIQSYKNAELIRFLVDNDGSGYFVLTQDYIFVSQRAATEVLLSSSSSSSSSSSESSNSSSSSSLSSESSNSSSSSSSSSSSESSASSSSSSSLSSESSESSSSSSSHSSESSESSSSSSSLSSESSESSESSSSSSSLSSESSESSSSSSSHSSESSESSSSSSSLSSESSESSESSSSSSSLSSESSESSSSSSSLSSESSSSSSSHSSESSESSNSSSSSSSGVVEGWTWGYETPVNQAPVVWTNWKYIESAVEARNTGEWGDLQLKHYDVFVSDVKDTESTSDKTLTVSYDDYGTGFGTGYIMYRTSSTAFAQNSGEPPVWLAYSVPVVFSERYVQIAVRIT